MLSTASIILALASLSFVAAQGGQACNATSLCPSQAPCCSEFGFCGVDSFCLGGCNPLSSHSPDSCKPNTLCKSGTYNLGDFSRIQTNATFFDGNATKYDWVVNSGNIIPGPNNGSMVMTLDEKNLGTRLSSTRYVHYGEISAQVQTGKWAGVVTAFITMSDIKDEIDWEFPGTNVTQGQTNMFWQGHIPDLTQGDVTGGLSDTSSNWHTFTVNWLPDTLTWSIDGKVVRTLNKKDTTDPSGASGFKYPSTPSRIQLSIWPGGLNTSAPGTIKWAGGPINFKDPDYLAAGHFYASVKEVTVKCADPETPGSNATGYSYGTIASATNPDVALTNASTLIKNSAMPGVLALSTRTIGALAFAMVGAVIAL